MQEQRIIDLAVKEFSGTLSSEERNELENLVAENEANKKAYEDVQNAWKKSGKFKLSIETNTEASWEQFQKKREARPKVTKLHFPMLYRVAAAVVIAVGLSLVVFNPWQSVEYVTEVGETRSITLPDESVITLNESSRLVFANSFNEEERFVKLSGEAYFDVAHNPEKPFVIQSGISEVKVLGTSFNVDAKDSEGTIEVDVTSGRVSLSEIGNPENMILLTQGMRGSLNTQTQELGSFTHENENFLAWQTQELEFNDLGMNQVIEDISDYFGENIETDNPAILNCNFTSSFTNPTLEEVLEIISIALEIEVSNSGETYILSGTGCTE